MERRFVITDRPEWASAVSGLLSRGAVENEVFSLRPYALPTCTCGFDQYEAKWLSENPHHHVCAWSVLEAKYLAAGAVDALAKIQIRKGVLRTYGLQQMTCTCGHDVLFARWRAAHYHRSACTAISPNFVFHARKYGIWWNKKPLFGAWATHMVTDREFMRMITLCLAAL